MHTCCATLCAGCARIEELLTTGPYANTHVFPWTFLHIPSRVYVCVWACECYKLRFSGQKISVQIPILLPTLEL